MAKHSIAELQQKPDELENLLKQYAVKQIGKFAYNDTWKTGRDDTLKLALLGAFTGIFFLPMLAVAGGTVVTGLSVSKGVAVHEKKLFRRKLTELMYNDQGDDMEKKAAQKSLHNLINSWANMLQEDGQALSRDSG